MLSRLWAEAMWGAVGSRLPLPPPPEPEYLHYGVFLHLDRADKNIPYSIIRHRNEQPVLRLEVEGRRIHFDLRTLYILNTKWDQPRFMPREQRFYLRDHNSLEGSPSLDVTMYDIELMRSQVRNARAIARCGRSSLDVCRYDQFPYHPA